MNPSLEEVLKQLFEYAESIGMKVFFDSEKPDFEGFIIGTEEFFTKITEGEEDLGNYDMVTGIEHKDKKYREDLH